MRGLFFVLLVGGCAANAGSTAPPPTCDAVCQDGVALRAVRETMKLAYNLTLQGKSVGAQDLTTPCPQGGTARVFGTATSNGLQGTTEIALTYELTDCAYLQIDTEPKQSYSTVVSGTVTQRGVLAVQPSAASAVIMKSEAVKVTGTVYNPPLPYDASCPLTMGQDGNALSGTICGRTASAAL